MKKLNYVPYYKKKVYAMPIIFCDDADRGRFYLKNEDKV